MDETNVLLEAIRSLSSEFQVAVRDSQRLELALKTVAIAGVEGSYVMTFTSPRRAWAMEWDSAHSKWVERPDLSSPASGLIAEAFVKQIPGGYAVSFSDRSDPLVRWGFYATDILVRPTVQG